MQGFKKSDFDQETADIINLIFTRFKGFVTALKYNADCITSLDSIKFEYTDALIRNNVRDLSSVIRGINRLSDKGSPFLPSPGEFIALCKATPEDIGAPTVEVAFREACYNSNPSSGTSKKWSHPTVKFAWRSIGSWELQQSSRVKTLPVFHNYYLDAISRYANGELQELLRDETKRHCDESAEKQKQKKISSFTRCHDYESSRELLTKILGPKSIGKRTEVV